MTKLLLRLVINMLALYAAMALVPGIQAQSENWLSFIWLALIFGLINALLRPLLMLLTCPLIILTLGLGTLLINTLLFYLAGVIGQAFNVGFTVDGFWPAFLGALVVSIVSMVLSLLLRDELHGKNE
jgi:putative membrane protein